MTSESPSFDICIVCALYEEARAVLDEIAARCTVSFTRAFSRIDGYEYRYTTIQNNKGEPLTVLVTWLADSGPIRTSLDLKPLLSEFRPRFAAMTGICAGYREKVRLGDLVVAQYAYHYEEGKILIGSDGQPKHVPETKTYGTTEQILHYVRGFEAWEEPVTELKRSKRNRQVLKASERPKCYIAPMASGMVVRSDNPFPWLVEYQNRKTIALDMEAAAFYLTLHGFPGIYALVVKGVCDYADMTKNDTYHNYAARASAIYLLYFIQEYVTEETMSRGDHHQNPGRVDLPPLSSIPQPRQTDSVKQEPKRIDTTTRQKVLPSREQEPKRIDTTTRQKLFPSRRGQKRDPKVIWGSISVVLVLLVVAAMFLPFSPITLYRGQDHQPTATSGVVSRAAIINEFSIPTGDSNPTSITRGPDGNLWFTEKTGNKIGRITPQGRINEFPITTPNSISTEITPGSDGNLWFFENGGNKIGRITPQGHITEFPAPEGSNLVGITSGPDGNLWFTEYDSNKIGRMTTSGAITGEFMIPTANSGTETITAGPDGNVWFVEDWGNKIGRITPQGIITEFPIPIPLVSGKQNYHDLTTGPDGNLWFTEGLASKVGRITPQGHITEFPVPLPGGYLGSLCAGPDGNLWLTDAANHIDRMTTSGAFTDFFKIPTPESEPAAITVGPDKNIWFTEYSRNKIGKVMTVITSTIPTSATNTVTPTPIATDTSNPYGGTLILDDPLKDNSKGYSWDVTTTHCIFRGGAYHVTASRPIGYEWNTGAASTTLSNLSYEITMVIVQGSQGGMCFRFTINNQSGYCFIVNKSGHYILETINYDNQKILASGESNYFFTEPGKANQIAVVAVRDKIDLYLNGHFVNSAKDTSYSYGLIGVFASYSGVFTDIP